VKAIRVGSILDAKDGEEIDMGAMISDASFTRLEKLVQSAVADGARLLAGGARYNHPRHKHGHYFEPTLLVDVTANMAIAREEVFGPIMVLMKANSVSDAISIANAPDFGLGASVFGYNKFEVNQVVKGVKTGMVAVNDFAVFYAVQLPFGGVKGSGYGRFAGEEGLRSLCNVKAVCEDRWGALGVNTAIPPTVRYPIANTQRGFEFVKSIVDIGYGGVTTKLYGIKRLLQNL
jgi:acyl-CoA reductase-like NAD-dependent aldehyde dehydrogenase